MRVPPADLRSHFTRRTEMDVFGVAVPGESCRGWARPRCSQMSAAFFDRVRTASGKGRKSGRRRTTWIPTDLRYCGDEPCESSALTLTCDQNVEIACSDGVAARRDCGTLGPGIACRDGVGCSGTGPHCYYSRCVDGEVVSCLHSFETGAAPCVSTIIPMTCESTAASCHPAPDLECDPVKFKDACNSGKLSLCDGSRREIACSDFGFTRCEGEPGMARCRW